MNSHTGLYVFYSSFVAELSFQEKIQHVTEAVLDFSMSDFKLSTSCQLWSRQGVRAQVYVHVEGRMLT